MVALDYGAVVVFSSFFLHFITLGSVQTFGLIYSELLLQFDEGKSNTSWIASLNLGMMLLSGPITGIIVTKVGCRVTAILGSIISAAGVTGSAFVHSLYLLYLTYGIIAGFGFGLIHLAMITTVNIHFDKHRSLAMGIATGGAGVGTVVLPIFLQHGIDNYGWRSTFIILGGICLQGVVLGALLRPPGRAKSAAEDTRNGIDCGKILTVALTPSFVLWTLSTSLFALGYLPFVMLPDLMQGKGYTPYNSALAITIAGVTSIVGRITIGFLSDIRRINRYLLFSAVMFIAGASTFPCGHYDTLYLYISYAVLLGIFMGAFGTLLAIITQDVVGVDAVGIGFGILTFFHGICVSIGYPIGGMISDYTGSYTEAFYFAGACFTLGGLILLGIPIIHNRQTGNSYKVNE